MDGGVGVGVGVGVGAGVGEVKVYGWVWGYWCEYGCKDTRVPVRIRVRVRVRVRVRSRTRACPPCNHHHPLLSSGNKSAKHVKDITKELKASGVPVWPPKAAAGQKAYTPEDGEEVCGVFLMFMSTSGDQGNFPDIMEK